MDVKIGDIYIRQSDGKNYRVKKIDNNMIVLEAEDGRLALTELFGLGKKYRKKEPAQ